MIMPGGARGAVVVVAAGALLAACAVLSAGDDPPKLYTLTPKSTFDASLRPVSWQLVVEPPTASAYLNTSRIAVAMTPTSADYFAQSAWTDRAPLMVQTLMVESLETSRRVVGVGRDAVSVRPHYVLQSELREFQAEYFQGKLPMVHVRIVVRLVRQSDRQIVASHGFERCVRADTDKIPVVVQAFDDALGWVLKRLVAWTVSTPPPRALADGETFPTPRGPATGDDSSGCPQSPPG